MFSLFLNSDTKYLKWLFPQHMKSNLYRLCYTHVGQDFSICNYWNGKIIHSSPSPAITTVLNSLTFNVLLAALITSTDSSDSSPLLLQMF